VYQEEPTLQ